MALRALRYTLPRVIICVDIRCSAASSNNTQSLHWISVLCRSPAGLNAHVSSSDVAKVARTALADAEVIGGVPELAAIAGGVAHICIGICVEGVRALGKAAPVGVSIGTIRTGTHADEVSIVDKIVS